jgi:hypothetical protein
MRRDNQEKGSLATIVGPIVHNLFDRHGSIWSRAKGYVQLCASPRWGGQLLCDRFGRARKNCRALNSTTLKRAEQAL